MKKSKKKSGKPAKRQARPQQPKQPQQAQQPQKPQKPAVSAAKKPKQKPLPKKKNKQTPEAVMHKQAARKPEKAVQQPAVPVSGEQKKAYNKAVKSRAKKAKKHGSRGGNYSLYYLFAAIVAIVVFVILAKTVLFNCANIEVEGNTRYTTEEIVQLSGIQTGTSLLDIDTDAASKRIVSALAYVDAAEVKKSFPTKIRITITEAEKWYCVQQDGRPYIVSRLGKILEEKSDSSLPAVYGFEAVEPKVGGFVVSAVETKTNIPSMVLTAAESAGVTDITSIDITDRFEIKVLVQDRITLELGNSLQLENKMFIAKELIESEISATESVTVNLTNTEKVYVRDNNIIENPTIVPELPPEDSGEATGEATGEAAATAEAG